MDALPWPDLKALLTCIKEQPPVDMIEMAKVKANAPQSDISSTTVPHKIGKVKHRPTLGRKTRGQ